MVSSLLSMGWGGEVDCAVDITHTFFLTLLHVTERAAIFVVKAEGRPA